MKETAIRVKDLFAVFADRTAFLLCIRGEDGDIKKPCTLDVYRVFVTTIKLTVVKLGMGWIFWRLDVKYSYFTE